MTSNSLYDKKLLTDHYHADIRAFYFLEWNGFRMPEQHAHDQLEIMHVINGRCIVEVSNLRFNLRKNDMILLDANTPHSLKLEPEEKCRMLNIEFGFRKKDCIFPSIKDIAENVPAFASLIEQKSPYLLLRDTDELSQSLKDLIIEISEKKDENKYIIQMYLSEILVKLSRIAQNSSISSTSANTYVRKALIYLNSNYDRDICVKDIAWETKINESYLQRIFKSQTGSTITEYLTSIRVEKAKTLLTHTDIPVIDISEYVGINSRQYFSYVFKRYTGQSPAQYRKGITLANGY